MKKILMGDSLQQIERWMFPDVASKASMLAHKFASLSEKPSEKVTNVTVSEADLVQREQAAFARGLQQGIAQADQQVQAEVEQKVQLQYQKLYQEKLEVVDKLLQSLQEPLALVTSQLEQQLQQLTLLLAEKLVCHELTTHPERVLSLIRKAQVLLPISSSKVKLYVNPEDLEIVRAAQPKKSNEDIIADNSLSRGEVRYETDSSQIDGTLSKRIEALANKVFSDVE